MTVHGGSKLGVIKSTATGIELDIDGHGRGPGRVGPAAGPSDVGPPPWLRDQPLSDTDQMTLADLDRLDEKTKHQDAMNRFDLFSRNPQGTTPVLWFTTYRLC